MQKIEMLLLEYLLSNSKPNMCFTAEQMRLIKKAKAGKLKLNIINQDKEDEEGKEWCEVGEHYVDADEMWDNFADCKNCVSEKEYLEFQQDEEEEVQKNEMDLQEISNSIKTNMNCIECDYSLTENEFDAGKGRIMFSEGEGIEKGQFRCGKCDIRADEMGYFPIEDEEDAEEGDCVICGEFTADGWECKGNNWCCDGCYEENGTECWKCDEKIIPEIEDEEVHCSTHTYYLENCDDGDCCATCMAEIVEEHLDERWAAAME